MDRVVSSYTPTVGALAHARTQRPAATPGAAPQSLIVAMPTTPHLPAEARLAYVQAEANLLQRRLPNPTVLIEPPPAAATANDGQLPTRAAVLQRLPDCAIAHFACHGSTDPADPSQNRLLLHDHRTSPLTVAALAPVVLEHAQLCYLSACSTARLTDDRLPDEAIHLATAFQLAGFPHVIGTLWEIDDAIAVEIADAFYTALAGPNGALDPSHAASAIHQAARALRDRFPAAPYLWASHIHAGA
jgi:CHAT domain-containing protein